MAFLLAVSGKKQSGKDTLVNAINPLLEAAGTVEHFTFADQLKKFLVDGMGLEPSSVWGSNEDKNRPTNYVWDGLPYEIRKANAFPGTTEARTGPMSGREIMQVFGTDIMREFFDDRIWVNSCFRAISKSDPDFALLPDMRFPSELNPWIEEGGYIIRLMRDVSEGDKHSSETALDEWDWEQYGDRVLLIPEDATKEQCASITIEWLAPLIDDYLADYSDYSARMEAFHAAVRTE